MYMRNSNNRNNKTHKTTHNKQNDKKWKQENHQSGTANKIKCRQWGKNMRITTKIQKKNQTTYAIKDKNNRTECVSRFQRNTRNIMKTY